MTCGLCQRLRTMLFGRRHCEACEHARRAVEKHERSTENLTRAALDQIDRNVELAGESESQNDIRTLVEDMLRSLETPRSRNRDRGSC